MPRIFNRIFLTLFPLFSLLLLVLLVACASHIFRSGKYIVLQESDSVDSLSREFAVPQSAILNANRNAKWVAGEWIFIPQRIGILAQIYGDASLYGFTFLSPTNFSNGIFLWPVPSSFRITGNYGEVRDGHIHSGIDVASPLGNYVVAAGDGIVSFSSYEHDGYGEFLIIKHGNNISTVYGHLLKKLVRQGDQVYKGQIVALVGNSGRSTGPHLHFEIRDDGKTINPLPLLRSNG